MTVGREFSWAVLTGDSFPWPACEHVFSNFKSKYFPWNNIIINARPRKESPIAQQFPEQEKLPQIHSQGTFCQIQMRL